MLVKQSEIHGISILDLLNQMTYLEESYSSYNPEFVPIIRNDRFEQDLIKLESFCEYALENGIDDAGYAIASVCKANDISSRNIGFYVEEASCYADASLAETMQFLSKNGYRVCIAPISSTSTYYRALEEALELDEENSDYESSPYLQYYAGDYDMLSENVLESISKKVGDFKDGVADRISTNWQGMKNFASESKESIAKKYAAAKKKVAELANKAKGLAGDAKAFCLRQLAKAKSVMNSLKEKLISFGTSVKNTANKGIDTVRSKFA